MSHLLACLLVRVSIHLYINYGTWNQYVGLAGHPPINPTLTIYQLRFFVFPPTPLIPSPRLLNFNKFPPPPVYSTPPSLI